MTKLVSTFVSKTPTASSIVQSIAIAGLCTLPAIAWSQTLNNQQLDELPVKQITLFQSGVGYFTHNGAVEADSAISINFQAEQINDVLKSLVVSDPQQAIREVRYPSQDPLNRSLSGFAIDLSRANSLADILQQLRGAEVIVKAPDSIRGRVLSVNREEQIRLQNGSETLTQTVWLTLATTDGMQRLPLDSVQTIKPTNDKLNNELQQALLLLAENQSQNDKTVTLHFGGQNERDVNVSYLVETPVWKTTWRLDLGDQDSQNSRLQGWALVENTSDNDWNDVSLALISGQPVSYVMDLYTPLYAQRPAVAVPKPPQVEPKAYAGAMINQESDEDMQIQGRFATLNDARPSNIPADQFYLPGVQRGFAGSGNRREIEISVSNTSNDGISNFTISELVQPSEVGNFFEYRIQQPVNLPRRTSAMLPIVNSSIQAEKVSIYNANEQDKHPMHGVLLKNTSGAALMAGPVTLYQDGYAGDAQIGHIPENAERLLAYAVNLNVLAETESKSESEVTAATIVDGVLNIEKYSDLIVKYRFKNEANTANAAGEDDVETIIVEHPKNSGYELSLPAEAFETTDTHYRFKQTIPAGKTSSFTVKQRRTHSQSTALINWNINQLLSYSKNGKISDPVRTVLAEMAKRQRTLADLKARVANARNEINEITREQERLRENIKTVGTSSSMGKRYLKKLSTQETRIETLKQSIETLNQEYDETYAELADYLENLGTIE